MDNGRETVQAATRCRRARRGAGLVAVLGAGGVLLLGGCGNGLVSTAQPTATAPTSAPATSAPPSESASAEASSTPKASASASTTEPESSATAFGSSSSASTDAGAGSAGSGSAGSGSGSGGSGPGRTCRIGDLAVGVRASEGGGAAGSNYVLLTFRNTSSSSCYLRGYAGVSFVGMQNGTQLGHAADRVRARELTSVKLSVGETEKELLQIANAGNYDATECAPTTSDGFRVYPPAETKAAYVPFRTQACQSADVHQLSVYPVGTSG